MAGARRRLDAEMVRRNMMASREAAQKAIANYQVTVNGSIADKAARTVLPGDAIEILGPAPKYVGRGGDKLEGALASFNIDPSETNCIDVGSSTGGFTDCLLQRGAARVVAVDVGRAQLHERLLNHPRVDVHEQTDIRSVEPTAIGAPFDIVVIDVSFIGLDQILDVVASLAGPNGVVIALVKPQFEAGKHEASKSKGVIKDPEIWRRVLHESIEAARQRNMRVGGVDISPIKGGAGNVEFFLLIGGATSAVGDVANDDAVNTAVDRASALP